MNKITMHHILGNKVLEYDVDDRGVIIDEREKDKDNGDSEPSPPAPDPIKEWVKEHMVWWYDMGREMEYYEEDFTVGWINLNGTDIVTATSNEIIVKGVLNNAHILYEGGIVDTFSVNVSNLNGKFLQWQYANEDSTVLRIELHEGVNELPKSHKNTTTAFKGTVGVDYTGLTITQLPKKSLPTNEVLKNHPYLTDHSGNGRDLRLYNFLYAGMSGVGGYKLNWTDGSFVDYIKNGSRGTGTVSSNKINITSVKDRNVALVESASGNAIASVPYKVRITGLDGDITLVYMYYTSNNLTYLDITEDGEYDLPYSNTTHNYNMAWRINTSSYPYDCNITIEQIPLYPNSLVTDGTDDYGQVQNYAQGVKMLFMTVNPFSTGRMLYDQRDSKYATIEQSYFAIYNSTDLPVYNARNTGGSTYIDGVLNTSIKSDELLNRKHVLTILNNSVDADKTKVPIFFGNYNYNSLFSDMAFYNSIAFDEIPPDNILQDVIDHVIQEYCGGIPEPEPIQEALVDAWFMSGKSNSDEDRDKLGGK